MNKLNDLNQKYVKGTVVIHWLTALLIIVLFPLGKYMEGLAPADKMGLIQLHAGLGLLVFILTLFRTWLYFKAPRPDHIKTGSKFNDKLAIWIHSAFYFLLFAIAISGIATMILGGYGDAISTEDPSLILNHEDILPLKAHGTLAVITLVLLVMHIGGVIKHYISYKENTLRRIF